MSPSNRPFIGAMLGDRRINVLLAVDGIPLSEIGCNRRSRDTARPLREIDLIERGNERLEINFTTKVLVR